LSAGFGSSSTKSPGALAGIPGAAAWPVYVPKVPCQDYNSPSRHFVLLAPDFNSFAAAVCSRFFFRPDTAKLYWFDTHTPLKAQSHKLDACSYHGFADMCIRGDLHAVYVYGPTEHCDPPSPDDLPLAQSLLRHDDVADFDEDACESSSGRGSSRSSSMQSQFNKEVLRRDTCCVVCGERSRDLLEAAHILPRDCENSLAVAFGLPSSWRVENGIALCKPCHRRYDSHLFYIHDNTVIVADGLQEDATLGATWKPRHGLSVILPPVVVSGDRLGLKYWPSEQTFSFAKEGFDESQSRRHVDDNATFHCDTPFCSYSSNSMAYILRHKRGDFKSKCPVRVPFQTPSKAAAQSGGTQREG